MAERNVQQAQQARDELRRVVGYSVADEITKLDQLKKSGAITDDEFRRFVPNSSSVGRGAIKRCDAACGTERTKAMSALMSACSGKADNICSH